MTGRITELSATMRNRPRAPTTRSPSGRPRLLILAVPVLLSLGLLWSYQAFDPFIPNGADTALIPAAEQKRQRLALNALAMGFEQNLGQVDDRIAFMARAAGYALYLAPDQATVKLYPSASAMARTNRQNSLRMRFSGAEENIALEGRKLLRGRIHYLYGKESWRRNIPRYGEVWARGVYPGIDVVYYGGRNRQLEYDFRVAPGADPGRIGIEYRGADTLEVGESGDLLINVGGIEIRQLKPVIYQSIEGRRHAVAGEYFIKEGRTVGIKIAAYDKSLALVIDPVLEYASYLGGSSDDEGMAVAVDESGAIYVAGSAKSLDFPTKSPLQEDNLGDIDIFVAKLTPEGDALEYATYIGGAKKDQAKAMAVDGLGQVYLAGATESSEDFPIRNAFQATHGGGEDAFALKLTADGGELVYSTYLGGKEKDAAQDIAVDSSGNAYLTGVTKSGSGFPARNPLPAMTTNGEDAFLVRLAADGSLQSSTLFGGAKKDFGAAIALDPQGNIYLTGHTESADDFPLKDAWQPVSGGGWDIFIASFTPQADALRYSTFFGGSKDDLASDIAVDDTGQAHITGFTASDKDFPLRHAWQSAFGGSEDALIARFDENGQLDYSTYLGGKKKDAGLAIALDVYGGVTVAGRTTSKEALPTLKALQTELQGGVDILVARFDNTGNAVFSSYLGGEKDDVGEDIALNPSGEAYLVGSSRSTGALPLINPLQPVSGGGRDAYVARVHINGAPQFLSRPVTDAVEETPYQYPVEAEDPDGDPVSFALLAAPSGMEIDPDTGLIHWPAPRIGVYPVRIRLFDDMGAYADQNYELTVIPNNRPPLILSQPVIAAIVDQPYRYAVNAVDPDADPIQYRLKQAPLGMQIDPVGGLIEWRPVATGDYPVEIEVSDNNATHSLQNYTVTVSHDPDNLPPVFKSPGDQTVALGSTLTLNLDASDPENQPLRYSVAPLPLPEGATLDTLTGLFTFKPGPAQVGEWVFTFSVSDGRHLVKQTITVTVPAADPAAPTRMIGRVVDATALARGLELPVVGATVSFLGTGVETVTDGIGDFILSGIPEGVHVFSIDSSTADPAPGGAAYASFRVEMALIAHSDNIVSRPFSLPRIDAVSQTQINPVEAAVVSNPAIGVSLSIPPNTALNADGSQFTGQLSISQVPPDLAPGSLPEWLNPGFLITIQPLGVTFATPVPITFPNIDNLPAGSETDLWSLNPDTGQFIIVGTGRVSADGKRIETVSGGVRQSDWHAALPRQAESPAEPSPVNPDHECSCPEEESGSTVSLRDGRMKTQFSLPAYRSLEQSRALAFIYQSHQAWPKPAVPFNLRLSPGTAIPNAIAYGLTVAGLEQGRETFLGTQGLTAGRTLRSALAFDGSGFATGLYPYRRSATSHYNLSRIGRADNGNILVMNEQESPFGAGWMLEGLYRLAFNADASILLVSPNGRPINYRPGATPDVFTAPANDYARFVRNGDGSYTHTEKDDVKMHFDAEGLMTAREDRNRNITRYRYDGEGKLLTITDPVGLITRLDYVNGKLNAVTDPAGRITRFQHDAAGNLTRATYPDGTFLRHEYDDRHLLLARFDERGNAYRHRYDDFGRLIDATLPDGTVRTSVSQTSAGLLDTGADTGIGSESDPAPLTFADDSEARYVDGRGHLSRQTLDRHGRALIEIDELGRITSHIRDADSNPTRTTRPNGSVVDRTFDDFGNVLTQTEQFNGALYRYTYDDFSLVTSVTNPNNHTTTINRDPATGNPTAIVNHLGHTTTLEYDSRGLVIRSVSPNGLETVYTYNEQGLMETQTETPPAGSPGNVRVTRYDYYPTGLLKQVITPDNITLTYTYDARSDLTSVTDNLGQSIVYVYDAHKNVVRTDTHSSDGSLALTVARVYDERNRLKQTAAPHNETEDSVSEQLLDNNSNRIGLIDPNQNDSRNQYDAYNRLSRNIHRLDGVTEYQYDLLDRITKVSAPNSVVTAYENDLIGRRTKEISPDRGTVSYRYDQADNLIETTDGRGITAVYQYDELERVKSKTYPNTLPGKNENVRYTYDDCPFGIGRLCERQDESGHYRYEYDAYGNPAQMTFTEAAGAVYRTEYSYDDGDRIVQTVYPSGRVIDLQRDGVRRIERIDSRRDSNAAPQTLIDNLRYRGDNRMTQGAYGNGLIDERQYDLQGRLTHQRLKNSLNAVIDERTYQYDPNRNLLSRDTTPQNSRYRYDALDRLIHESNNALPVNDYFYDLNDNRLRKDGANRVETYRYLENSNRLDYTDKLDSSQKTQETQPRREMIYNDAGRLYQLIEDGVLKGEYLYNDEGQRTRKTVYHTDGSIDAVTIYHYDQSGQLIGETDEQGNPIKDYLHANGRPVAQIDRNGTTETIHYLTTDHLDTPRLATDQNQAVTWRWEGEAFGETPAQSFGATVNLRFPGQYFDAESGLHYNHFRYYDPSIGRYITSDPIGLAGGINTYSYVANNPLSFIDPAGTIGPGGAVIIGGLVGGLAQGVTTAVQGGSASDISEATLGGALFGATATLGALTGSGSLAGTFLGLIGGVGFDLGLNAIDVADILSDGQNREAGEQCR